MKKIILLLISVLFIQGRVLAVTKSNIEDRIIAATFKGIAKAYVAVVNLKQLKQEKIGKLKAMDYDEFAKRYRRVYMVISEFPGEFKKAYGVSENMDKWQAIRKINSLDKAGIFKMIDDIPDEIIAKQFKGYLDRRKQTVQGSNMVEQVKNFWERIVKK